METNGIRLHAVIQGQGPLMLFLHGFPEFWYSWRHQLAEFARDYTVVALDLRGYNESDKPPAVADYQLETLVQDVAGAITALGSDRCILVGHDWGGLIAWETAYRFPTWLESLVVINAPHPARFGAGLRTLPQLLKSWYIGFFQLPLLPELVVEAGDYWLIEQVFQDLSRYPEAFSPSDLKAVKAAAAKPGALTAMINYYRALPAAGLGSRSWPLLEVPTLLIWGEEDAFLGKELTDGTEAYVRDFHLRLIPHCSHWAQQQQPQLVNQYMRDFLALERRVHGAIPD